MITRFSLRRLVLILALMAAILVSFLHLHRTEPKLDLPELKTENSSDENGDVSIPEAPTKDAKTPESKDHEVKKITEYVFASDESSHFKQEVEFSEMVPFEEYRIWFNDKDIGRITLGELNKTELEPEKLHPRENGTFFSLVRNEDFVGIIRAIESVEARFNSKYHYDWVFANDKPFHPAFKQVVRNLVSGAAKFVEIPHEYWSYPEWIDLEKAEQTRTEMHKQKVKYGGSESYRHMCRFNSGLFYRLPVMQQYRYYWRVEPEVLFKCDIFETDWFRYMKEHNKKYAFTLSPLELHTTVVGLWDAVKEFADQNPKLVAKDNNMDFLTEDGGKTYNMCHFWSNFEIGDMDFYRGEAYSKFFDHIDRAGGFYYSRWGDAPIHSMAVSLLLSYEELFFMQNTGYYHRPNGDCPWDDQVRFDKRCACTTEDDFTWDKSSCIPKWFEVHNLPKPPLAPQYEFVNQHKPNDEEEEKEEEEDQE